MASAPATLAVADNPHTASKDRRRKRLRDNRSFAISATSAPPPCNNSYCCGVIVGLSIILMIIPHSLFADNSLFPSPANPFCTLHYCAPTRHIPQLERLDIDRTVYFLPPLLWHSSTQNYLQQYSARLILKCPHSPKQSTAKKGLTARWRDQFEIRGRGESDFLLEKTEEELMIYTATAEHVIEQVCVQARTCSMA